MTIKIFSLILISVTLSALAQVMLKAGMSSVPVQEALARAAWPGAVGAVACNPRLLLGLVLYGLSVGLWLLVLAKVDVSLAYPFVGLGFILTMLFSFMFLHEAIGPARVAGTLLVTIGVMLIASS